jgi:hypothetical protein
MSEMKTARDFGELVGNDGAQSALSVIRLRDGCPPSKWNCRRQRWAINLKHPRSRTVELRLLVGR